MKQSKSQKEKKVKLPKTVRGYIFHLFPVEVSTTDENVELVNIPFLGERITTWLFEFSNFFYGIACDIKNIENEDRVFPIYLPKKSQEILEKAGLY